MVVVSILLRAKFGLNDYQGDAPHFIFRHEEGGEMLSTLSELPAKCIDLVEKLALPDYSSNLEPLIIFL